MDKDEWVVGAKNLIRKSIEQKRTCWNWKGRLHLGYGYTYFKNKNYRAHRLSYEAFVGAIPSGLVIDHLCANKKCVNPKHLRATTQKDNIRTHYKNFPESFTTAFKKTLMVGGKCRHGHTLEIENCYIRANGYVQCRTCRTAQGESWRSKHPEYYKDYVRPEDRP